MDARGVAGRRDCGRTGRWRLIGGGATAVSSMVAGAAGAAAAAAEA